MKREPKAVDADAPDIEGLREFARSSDRKSPPFFAGRSREIGQIRDRLRYSIKNWRDSKRDAWTGQTSVIQGAPGVGKTALLEHLAETLTREFAGANLQVCKLDSEALGDETYWREQLGEALFEGAGARLKATLLLKAGADAKVVAAAASLAAPLLTWGDVLRKAKAGAPPSEAPESEAPEAAPANSEESSSRENPGGTIRALKSAASQAVDALSGLGPIRPVLLLIDEVQNAPGEPKRDGRPATGPAAAFLSSMHKSTHALPVFPAYGGLAWSSRRLDELGLSRTSLGYVRTLDPLSAGECREAVAGFFARFRVRGADELKNRWGDAITVDCQGWPQHLHAHFQALAEGLVRDDLDEKGDLEALESAGLDAVVAARAKEKREAYYEERLDSSGLGGRPCLAAVGAAFVADADPPAQIAELGERLDRASENAVSPNLRLPKGMDGEDFADAMVRAGILHMENSLLKVPIPSFRSYLERKYDADKRLEGASAPPLPP